MTRMTIERLAEMVARGFSHIDERFSAADERFSSIDNRFSAIDKKLDTLSYDVEALKNELTKKADRSDIEDLREDMAAFTSDIHDRLIARIDTVAAFVGIPQSLLTKNDHNT